MNKVPAANLDHEIDQVERRIEVRRHRLVRHVGELQEAARERARPLPLLGLAVFAVAGFAWARGQRRAVPRRHAEAAVARTGLLAGIAAVLHWAFRLATNPLVRAGWDAYRRPRR
jgi:peptidoglycan/LPS O-acetylase OafA/YrhL